MENLLHFGQNLMQKTPEFQKHFIFAYRQFFGDIEKNFLTHEANTKDHWQHSF